MASFKNKPSMPQDNLRVLPVNSKKGLKRFISFPYQHYQKDPHWIPPLEFERRGLIDPQKNPFFEHAQAKLFTAWRGNTMVGRISAQVDQEYENFQGEKVGHFGFFESENNPETAKYLFTHAENFLDTKGCKKVLGPFNYSINQESGLLIEGFSEPLMIMSPYNPPYYSDLMEQNAYQKAKDLYAWRFETDKIPQDPQEIAAEVQKIDGVQIRPINPKNIYPELKSIIAIFNSAWSKNWGFVPWTESEIKKVAKEIKILIDPTITFFIEVKGEPAGICFALPNPYDIIGDLRGKLFPFGWTKFLWRLKTKQIRSSRLLILGVEEKFRTFAMGGLSTLLYVEAAKRNQGRGYQWGELGWTLEDNDRINAGIEFMEGKKYKTFRIYQKDLS